MEYFDIQKGGVVRVGKSGKKSRVSREFVVKAMQKGGGMMYDPKSGKTTLWSGVWSPSDVGKKECGVTRRIEPGEDISVILKGGGIMFGPGRSIQWPSTWSPSDIGKRDCGQPMMIERLLAKPIKKPVIMPITLQQRIKEAQKEAENWSREISKELLDLDLEQQKKVQGDIDEFKKIQGQLVLASDKKALENLVNKMTEQFRAIQVKITEMKPVFDAEGAMKSNYSAIERISTEYGELDRDFMLKMFHRVVERPLHLAGLPAHIRKKVLQIDKLLQRLERYYFEAMDRNRKLKTKQDQGIIISLLLAADALIKAIPIQIEELTQIVSAEQERIEKINEKADEFLNKVYPEIKKLVKNVVESEKTSVGTFKEQLNGLRKSAEQLSRKALEVGRALPDRIEGLINIVTKEFKELQEKYSKLTDVSVYFGLNKLSKNECEARFQQELYKRGKELAKGTDARVYEVCQGLKECQAGKYPYVVKVTAIDKKSDPHANYEIEIMEKLKGIGLSIELIKWWDCPIDRGREDDKKLVELMLKDTRTYKLNTMRYMIMERWDGTLDDFIKDRKEIAGVKFDKDLLHRVFNLIEDLHKIGVTHHDPKSENVFYRVHDGQLELALGDFGLSWDFKNKPGIFRGSEFERNVMNHKAYDYMRLYWDIGVILDPYEEWVDTEFNKKFDEFVDKGWITRKGDKTFKGGPFIDFVIEESMRMQFERRYGEEYQRIIKELGKIHRQLIEKAQKVKNEKAMDYVIEGLKDITVDYIVPLKASRDIKKIRELFSEAKKAFGLLETLVDLQLNREKIEEESNEQLESLKKEFEGLEVRPGLSADLIMSIQQGIKNYESIMSHIGASENQEALNKIVVDLSKEYEGVRVALAQLKTELAKPVAVVVKVPTIEQDQCEAKLLKEGYQKASETMFHEGTNVVTQLCKKKDCNFVLKAEPYISGEREGYEREIENLEIVRKKKLDKRGNIVVKMIKHWNCTLIESTKNALKRIGLPGNEVDKSTMLGYIVLDKINGTAGQLRIGTDEALKLLELMDNLHKIGFVWYQLGLSGIWYKANVSEPDEHKFIFGDMGKAWYFKDSKDDRLRLNMQAVDYLMLARTLEKAGAYNDKIADEFRNRFTDLIRQGWDYKSTDTDYLGDSQYWNSADIRFGEFAGLEISGLKLVEYLMGKTAEVKKLQEKTTELKRFEKDVPEITKDLATIFSTQKLAQGIIKKAGARDFKSRDEVEKAREEFNEYLRKWTTLNEKMNKVVGEKVSSEKRQRALEAAVREEEVKAFFSVEKLPQEYRNECMKILGEKQYQKGEVISSGKFGMVSELCYGLDNCQGGNYKYVIKMQPFSKGLKRGFERESKVAMALRDRVPKDEEEFFVKVIDVWDCKLSNEKLRELFKDTKVDVIDEDDHLGIMIMDKWDGSVADLIEKGRLTSEDIKKLIRVLDLLHKYGVIHLDIHPGNFLYKDTQKGRQFGVTDLGYSWDIEEGWPLSPSKLPNHLGHDYYELIIKLEKGAPLALTDEVKNMFFERFWKLRRDYNWYMDPLDTISVEGIREWPEFAVDVAKLAFTPEDDKLYNKRLDELSEGLDKLKEVEETYNEHQQLLYEIGVDENIEKANNLVKSVKNYMVSMEDTYVVKEHEKFHREGMKIIEEAKAVLKVVDGKLQNAWNELQANIKGTKEAFEKSLTQLSVKITGLKMEADDKPDAFNALVNLQEKINDISAEVNKITYKDVKSREILNEVRNEIEHEIADVRKEIDQIKGKITEEKRVKGERKAALEAGEKVQKELQKRVDEVRNNRDKYEGYRLLPKAIDETIVFLNKQLIDVLDLFEGLTKEDTVSEVKKVESQLRTKLKNTEGISKGIEESINKYNKRIVNERIPKQQEALGKLKKRAEKFLKVPEVKEKAQDLLRQINEISKEINDIVKKPYIDPESFMKIVRKIINLQRESKKILRVKITAESPEKRSEMRKKDLNELSDDVQELKKSFVSEANKLRKQLNEFDKWRKGKFVDFIHINSLLEKADSELSNVNQIIENIEGRINVAQKMRHWGIRPELSPIEAWDRNRDVIIILDSRTRKKYEEPRGGRTILQFLEVDLPTRIVKYNDLVNKKALSIPMRTQTLERNANRGDLFIETDEMTFLPTMDYSTGVLRQNLDDAFEELTKIVENVNKILLELDRIKDEYERRETELAEKLRRDSKEFNTDIRNAQTKEKEERNKLIIKYTATIKKGEELYWEVVSAEEQIEVLIPTLKKLIEKYKSLRPILKNLEVYQSGYKGVGAVFSKATRFPTDFNKYRDLIEREIRRALKISVEILDETISEQKKKEDVVDFKKILTNLSAKIAELSVYNIIPFSPEKLIKMQKEKKLSKLIADAKVEAKGELEKEISEANKNAEKKVNEWKRKVTIRPRVSPKIFKPPTFDINLLKEILGHCLKAYDTFIFDFDGTVLKIDTMKEILSSKNFEERKDKLKDFADPEFFKSLTGFLKKQGKKLFIATFAPKELVKAYMDLLLGTGQAQFNDENIKSALDNGFLEKHGYNVREWRWPGSGLGYALWKEKPTSEMKVQLLEDVVSEGENRRKIVLFDDSAENVQEAKNSGFSAYKVVGPGSLTRDAMKDLCAQKPEILPPSIKVATKPPAEVIPVVVEEEKFKIARLKTDQPLVKVIFPELSAKELDPIRNTIVKEGLNINDFENTVLFLMMAKLFNMYKVKEQGICNAACLVDEYTEKFKSSALRKFVKDKVEKVQAIKIQTDNPQYFIDVVDRAKEIIKQILKTKNVSAQIQKRMEFLNKLLDEEKKIAEALKKERKVIETMKISFPVVKTQDDVPKLIKFLEDQAVELTNLRLKYLKAETSLEKGEIERKARNIITTVLDSVSQNVNPGLYKEDLLYKEITGKFRAPVIHNYLQKLASRLVKIEKNSAWFFDAEDHENFKLKYNGITGNLGEYNKKAKEEIDKNDERLINTIRNKLNEMAGEKYEKQANDKERLKEIIEDLGKLKTITKGIINNEKRLGIALEILNYYNELKKANEKNVKEVMEEVLISPIGGSAVGGSRQRRLRH